MPKLKPPKNKRSAIRVCAMCKYFRMDDGWSECIRPDGPDFDNGDMLYFLTTCDRWKGHADDEAMEQPDASEPQRVDG